MPPTPGDDILGSAEESDAEIPDLSPDDQAPFGYTIDRATGEKRPKKRAGRPQRDTPTKVEEVPEKTERIPDRVPGKVKPEEKRRGRQRAPKPDPEPVPPFRAGPIAKGINKLYLKAGKIVRAMDYDIGTAIIAITKKESEEDITVGEAWEEIAKVNPRIRRVLLKLISGGAWGQLLMAHAPILVAILMKESISRKLPLMRFVASVMDDSTDNTGFENYDDDNPDTGGVPNGIGGLLAGLTQEDLNQAMSAFSAFMPTNGRIPEQTREPVAEHFDIEGGD
jgi:hypothetical protein